ncbi:DNA polymerase III subunit delta' [Burkholderiaceae bacterium DAT-1]|nr:DNA polymerase III subunit delta' [Burkholderiaceae bacterium DAT-1]
MLEVSLLHRWHEEAWQALMAQSGRMHHALLITGEAGIGKLAFARHLAQSLLCESKEVQPCGQCDACHWFLAGHHPDFRELTPTPAEEGEEDGKLKKKAATHITVEQVRDLAQFVNLTAHRGGKRVTLVHPADALNVASANALLKTLEEPPEGAMFILVSSHWQRLLPTIRSRCRRFPLSKPVFAEAEQWLADQGLERAAAYLAEAGGAPLLALESADPARHAARDAFLGHLLDVRKLDPLALAERLDKDKVEPARVADWLARWVYDLSSLRLTGSIRYHPDHDASLRALSAALDPVKVMRFHDTLLDATRLAGHPLNARLVFEQLLMAYQQMARSATR